MNHRAEMDSSESMEVMRSNFDVSYIQGEDAVGLDMNGSLLMLKRPFHLNEMTAGSDNPILLKSVGCKYDVGNAVSSSN